MAPEHSDGLDDYDVPPRTATAGEEFAVTMRRTIAYGGTNSASTPDGSMQRLGTVTTLAGRRSARLTSLAATGGGIAAEDPETQAELLHTLQVEQEVKARLRAELPPINDDWSESGGDVEPGAEYEVDYVEPPAESDDTWVRIVDDSGVVRVMRSDEIDDGARRSSARLMAATGPLTMCANHERCGRKLTATVFNPGYCCDECECTHGREHAEDCCVDQTTDPQASEHVPGSAEMEATLNDTKPAPMDF